MGQIESLALPFESYKLAFTPELAQQMFVDSGKLTVAELNDVLADEGKYVHSESDANWWIPSGRIFYSPGNNDIATQELGHARTHFFLPHRYRDPFGATASVSYDRPEDAADPPYDLLIRETVDPLGNRVTVGERLPNGAIDTTKPGNDYRVLQPRLMTDPNRNRTEVAFDTLGMVAGTAVKGKDDTVGDTLSGFEPDLTQAQVDGFYDVADPHVPAPSLLQGATTRIIYDLDRFLRTQQAHPADPTQWLPVYAATLARETHVSDPLPPQGLKIQISFSYSDGFGREIQKKIQAEPEKINGVVGPPRWVGSGWTSFNNKGKPVRQYEPFFSQLPERRHRFEFGVEVGVSPVLFYDPVERVVATLHPNHTYEKVVFDPWQQTTWDVNDTTKAPDNPGDPPFDPKNDPDVGHYFGRLPDDEYLPTWYDLRTNAANALEAWPDSIADNVERRAAEKIAANKASVHANTPTTAHVDPLGQPFVTVAINRFERKKPDNTSEIIEEPPYHTRVELDIEGNQRAVRDANKKARNAQGNEVEDELGRVVMRYAYDMLSNRIHQLSMEAGARWMLNDVAGKPIRAWDGRGHTFRTEYDPLRRPLRTNVTVPANPNQELLTERLVYGEQHPEAELRNLRGKLYLHLDQAGVVASEAHDFKGNPLRASRRLTNGTQFKQTVDWRAVDADHVALPTDAKALLDPVALEAALAPRLEADTYTSRTTYDALNRPITLTTPHTPTMQPSVIRPGYNEANLLDRVDAMLRGAVVATPFVTNIDYDAKGQRTLIEYGSGAAPGRKGVTTTYEYDSLTFRLVHLLTRRNAVAFSDDCPQSPPAGWPGCQVQNLHYTYDPVGNITHIRDDAQQTMYFRNQRVEPSNDYTYDALYRLIEATGREHLGQVGGAPIPHSHNDAPRAGIRNPGPGNRFHPGDGTAIGRYCENYVYDAVGNIMEMIHRRSCPGIPAWTRTYAYDETSLIEDGAGGVPRKTSNRLNSTTVGNNSPPVERYVYDAHGNMTRMSHLGGAHPDPNMHWDYQDQLRQTDLGGGSTAYYVYDAAGQRVRKVWEKSANLIEERLYLGGFEIFRRHGGPIGANTATLERETLHIMDDKQRIAAVETRTAGNDPAPQQLIRYQFGNHLGSASLELDDQAQIISYEEYTPYGSTSYQAVRSQTETPKRYRYTGKERDEESGLYYHGARYYVAWLARWSACDPIGIKGGQNLYEYATGNPLRFTDKNGTAPVGETDAKKTVDQKLADINAREREIHLKAAAMEAALVTQTVPKEHEEAVKRRGIGTSYGTYSTFASDPKSDKTGLEECNCILYQFKPVEEHIRSLEAVGELPKGTWDLVSSIAKDARGNRLDKKGNEKEGTSVDVGRDTVFMEQLRSEAGYTTVLVDRGDKWKWKKEPPKDLPKAIRSSGGMYPPKSDLVKGADSGKALDVRVRVDTVFTKSKNDRAKALAYLKDLPFAIITEQYGFHTLVLSYGTVYEAHWTGEPTDTEKGKRDPVYDRTLLDAYLKKNPHVLFAVPPGYQPQK